MHRARPLALVGLICVVLSGCSAPAVDGTAARAPTLTATPASTAPPTPSPTVTEAEPALIVSLDDITVTRAGETEETPLADGSAIVALVTELADAAPQETAIEDPWGNGEVWGTRYEWPDAVVSVFDGQANLIVRSPRIGAAPVATAAGISVGSTRAEVVAADGWDEWDEDGDGVADHLGIAGREVAGTSSLSRPGEVGIEYISLTLAQDVVTEIHLPANDFSDI
jgi:hypothetical protein